MSELAELERVAEMAVEKTFVRLGIDITSPAAAVSAQSDFAFLRNLRHTVRIARAAIITTAIGGLGTVVWHAMKAIAAD